MALIQVNYLSKSLYRTVPINVVLPVDKLDYATGDYLPDTNKFKTLYLLHGLLGNYTDWISGTRLQRWAEEKNLAVVMPSGDNAFYINSKISRNNYEQFIGKELVEITRRMFPLSDRREDTYIAGLSMGGYGALRNGLVFSEVFSHIAGMSSAVHIFNKEIRHIGGEESIFGDLEEAAKTNLNPRIAFMDMINEGRDIPRIYMSCGCEDDLFDINTELRDFFRENGADVTWDEETGRGHDWDFWDSQIKKIIDWLPLENACAGIGSGNVK